MNRPAVKPRPAAGGCREAFVQNRIEYRTHQQLAVVFQGQRHAIMRDAVDKISRAVQGIDNPAEFGSIDGCLVGRFLLAQQTVVGKGPQHGSADGLWDAKSPG